MLRALWSAWCVFAKKLGMLQSRIILTVFYFVVLAPFALAVRIFLDPLRLRGKPSWKWLTRENEPAAVSLRRQS